MISSHFVIHPLQKADDSNAAATAKSSPQPVPADSPTMSEFEEPLHLMHKLVNDPDNTYLVKVNDVSMIQAGIADGDWLVVDTKIAAADGGVVMALVDGEFVLKRYYNQDGLVRLSAENPGFPSITLVEGDEAAIWGVVTHVIKDL